MSRSGYCDDGEDNWALIRYRGAVKSAMRGKRGQQFFADLVAALDALPEKRLIANSLETQEGAVCALGALGKAREIDLSKLDPHDPETVAGTFGIAECLARETVWENDEACYSLETPEHRFIRVRAWAASNIFSAQSSKSELASGPTNTPVNRES